MNSVAAERPGSRRAPRFPFEQVVSVRSLDGRFDDASGLSRDVSACGIFFYVDEFLPVGAMVEVLTMMPQDDIFVRQVFPLRCYGVVVRVTHEMGRCGVAIAFEKIEVVAEA